MINSSWLNNLRHNVREINISTSSAVITTNTNEDNLQPDNEVAASLAHE